MLHMWARCRGVRPIDNHLSVAAYATLRMKLMVFDCLIKAHDVPCAIDFDLAGLGADRLHAVVVPSTSRRQR